ncbi:MAG: glycosyltransferase [Planctomycetota bacterium]
MNKPVLKTEATSPRPLNAMFVLTSLPVGGAETLLRNLTRTFNPERIRPLVCCLKEPGELGEQIAAEVPLYSRMLRGKYDVFVLQRLSRLFRREKVDAVVTVGAGDKMFWGRLAARLARVPVILSALHSTGWPDGVGRLNRMLTPITDGFIAVARPHGQFLVEFEKFPQDKVFVIPNGIDTQQFVRDSALRAEWRRAWDLGNESPVVGIVAALRPEKNHLRFLRIARRVADQLPAARFVIAGDGPERTRIEQEIAQLGLGQSVRMLGTVQNIPAVLSMLDLFALTSDNEASPVSILEAMSCQLPVVAPRVGSIPELVRPDLTGLLVDAADEAAAAEAWLRVLRNPERSQAWGKAGRGHVQANGSLQSMTEGYEILISTLYQAKQWRGNRTMATGRPEARLNRVAKA